MTCSEEVRRHVLEQYISPARENGLETVTVRAGDVHNNLHWSGRVPSVCQALNSRKFQRQAGVELVDKSGPPSGLSTAAEFTYRLLDTQNMPQRDSTPSVSADPSSQKKPPTLLDLIGIGKEAFREVGGGEAFLKAERADWPDPWERFEIEKVTLRKKDKSS